MSSRTDAIPASRTDAIPASRTDAIPASRTDAIPPSRTDAIQRARAVRALLQGATSGAAYRPEAQQTMFMFGTGLALGTGNWWVLSPTRWASVVVVAVAANVLVFLCAKLAWRLWLYRRSRHPLPLLLVFSMSLGIVQLLLRGWGNALLAVPTPMTTWERVLAGAVQGLVWLIAASAYYEGRERFLVQREQLLHTRVQLELRDRRQSALTNLLTRELVDTIGARLAASVSDTRSLLHRALTLDDSAAALQRISTSLRGAIDQDIRPISRELWNEVPVGSAGKVVRLLLRVGCYANPYPVSLIGLFMVLAMLPTFTVLRDYRSAVLVAALQLAVVLSMLSFADEYLRRRDGSNPWDFWGWVLVTPVTVVLPWTLLPRFGTPVGEILGWVVFSVIGIPAIIVTAGLLAGVAGTRETVLDRVRTSIDFADVASAASHEQLREASRRLARHLHSSLQGRLMAVSLELERAARDGDTAQAAEALHRLNALLDASLVDAMSEADVDVVAALHTLVSEWAAIVDVELDITPSFDVPPHTAGIVVGVVEEAVANAVRHGGARTVRIEVQREADGIRVRVWNDGGRPRPGAQAAGLGSRWLDSVSPDRWRLTDHAQGTLLDVQLPTT